MRPAPGSPVDRRSGGSVVTGAVVVFMIVALLGYLVFAWVTIEDEPPATGTSESVQGP